MHDSELGHAMAHTVGVMLSIAPHNEYEDDNESNDSKNSKNNAEVRPNHVLMAFADILIVLVIFLEIDCFKL